MELINDIEIKFIYGFHKFRLIIFALDFGRYAMYLYTDYTAQRKYNEFRNDIEQDDEVFSAWIDSDGGEVKGNQRIVKTGYNGAIDYSYALFESIMRT